MLTAEVMFVNGLPFLITLSCSINLVTSEFVTTQTASNLQKLLSLVVTLYTPAGLKVQTTMMEIEFQLLQDLMPNVVIDTTAANKHVAEIKCHIQVIKSMPMQ